MTKAQIIAALLGVSLMLPAQMHGGGTSATVVAIMRFENLTGDKSLDWMGDGISETLSSKLADVPGIQVIERLQLLQVMKEQALSQTGAVAESTAIQVGRLAGARTVVLGSVQKIGDQVRIIARFVDAEQGTVAKSAEQIGAMAQLFTLEDQLALALLAEQGITATDSVKSQVQANPTASQPALEQSSLGDRAMATENYTGAAAFYQKAVKLDPGYVQALYQLGNAYAAQGKYQLAIAQFRSVLRLRPRFADAHIRLAYAYKQQGKRQQAAAEYSVALRLRPAYAAVYQRQHGKHFQSSGGARSPLSGSKGKKVSKEK